MLAKIGASCTKERTSRAAREQLDRRRMFGSSMNKKKKDKLPKKCLSRWQLVIGSSKTKQFILSLVVNGRN